MIFSDILGRGGLFISFGKFQSEVANFEGVFLANFLLDGHIEAFARVESFGFAASELLLVPGFLVVTGPVVREAAAEHARVATLQGGLLVTNLETSRYSLNLCRYLNHAPYPTSRETSSSVPSSPICTTTLLTKCVLAGAGSGPEVGRGLAVVREPGRELSANQR